MINLRNSESKASKTIYAIVIIAFSVFMPAYFFLDTKWESFQLTPMAIILPALYIMVVIGFVLLALNIRLANVTSPDTDKKLYKKYLSIKKPLHRLLWFLIICNTLYAGYKLWLLLNKA